MSTDPAHSLGDSFEVEIGSAPAEIAPNLWAQQIDAQDRLEGNWREIQDYFIQLMNLAGTETIQAEELTVIPGLDEIFALIDVKTHVESGAYDMLVVDCAPTAETLRLLSLPEVMNWYIERIFPVERRVVKGRPPDRVEDDDAADRRGSGLRRHRTTPPEPRGGEEDPHRRRGVEREAGGEPGEDGHLGSTPHVHVSRSVRLPGRRGDRETACSHPTSPTRISASGKTSRPSTWRRSTNPSNRCPSSRPGCSTGRWWVSHCSVRWGSRCTATWTPRPSSIAMTRSGCGRRGTGYILSMRLPFVSRDDMDIHRRGEELFVRVGSYKRNLILPQTLKRMTVRGAAFEGDHLEIVFGREPRAGETEDGTPEKKTRKERKRDG